MLKLIEIKTLSNIKTASNEGHVLYDSVYMKDQQ